MRCMTLWSLLLLFALAACRRDADVPVAIDGPAATQPAEVPGPAPAMSMAPPTTTRTAPAAAESTLARYDGYGELRFGMSSAEVAQAWGGELKALPDAREPCHYLSPMWVKVPADFALMIDDDHFVRYDVGTNREDAPGGGRVGMAAAEIARRYPGTEHRPHKYVEGAQVLRISDPAGGSGVLVFETDAAGRVTAWHAGIAPQVDYVEGCS